jgi:hypothetical protein
MAILLLLSFALTGCANKEDTASPGTSADTSDTFNLADLSNPFLGEWTASSEPATNFVFKADGTFDYEMVGVPEEQGGKGVGGYTVGGDIIVSYYPSYGVSESYNFEIVDNDTMNVYEIANVAENGELVRGEVTIFSRTNEETAITKDTPLTIDNVFIGKWQSDIPSAGLTLIFDYKTDGTFDYEMVGVPADQGGVGTGCYIVYGDHQVSYLDFEGVAAYTFEVADADTINVTELEPDENGELVPGNTAPFTRVK